MRSIWFYLPVSAWINNSQCGAYLELARLLELVHVTLTLERTASSEEDVFVVAIDILDPRREPSDGLVVNDFLPVATDVRDRYRRFLADVDGDIFRTYSKLQAISVEVKQTE